MPKASGKDQAERFIETARELGCDESEERFEAAFRKIVPPKHEGDMAKPREGQKRSIRQKEKPGK
jgi:hypothetical protein